MIHKRKFFFHSEWTGFDNSSGDTRYHQVCFLNTCIFEHLSANFESEDLDLIRHRPSVSTQLYFFPWALGWGRNTGKVTDDQF